MTQPETRNSPINIRALPVQRALIDKAADILKKSRSEFMLEAACREAENVLLDRRLFFLDDAQYLEFEKLLRAPVAESVGNLLSAKAPWE
ncbi:type II toxin-antitoxin system TacA family antitoxin [Desulfonatronum parangueonense]